MCDYLADFNCHSSISFVFGKSGIRASDIIGGSFISFDLLHAWSDFDNIDQK